MSKDQNEVWQFRFVIEKESGEPIDSAVASELLMHILDWVEAHDLQMGGGYHIPKETDFPPFPVYDDEEDDEDVSATQE